MNLLNYFYKLREVNFSSNIFGAEQDRLVQSKIFFAATNLVLKSHPLSHAWYCNFVELDDIEKNWYSDAGRVQDVIHT